MDASNMGETWSLTTRWEENITNGPHLPKSHPKYLSILGQRVIIDSMRGVHLKGSSTKGHMTYEMHLTSDFLMLVVFNHYPSLDLNSANPGEYTEKPFPCKEEKKAWGKLLWAIHKDQ